MRNKSSLKNNSTAQCYQIFYSRNFDCQKFWQKLIMFQKLYNGLVFSPKCIFSCRNHLFQAKIDLLNQQYTFNNMAFSVLNCCRNFRLPNSDKKSFITLGTGQIKMFQKVVAPYSKFFCERTHLITLWSLQMALPNSEGWKIKYLNKPKFSNLYNNLRNDRATMFN